MEVAFLMRKIKKTIAACLTGVSLFTIVLSVPVFAYGHHGGGTNGHHDYIHENGYYYHHDYPAHLHPGGICPYGSNTTTAPSSSTYPILSGIDYQSIAQQQKVALQQQALIAVPYISSKTQQSYLGKQTEALLAGQALFQAKQNAAAALANKASIQLAPESVVKLQSSLNALGFPCGTPTGIFDPLTAQALSQFQQANGLPADGIVTPQIAALFGI